MSLPPSFSGMPTEEHHHYFRNVCIELKKAIKDKKPKDELEQQIDRFLNASREMAWPHQTSDVYHKDTAEKAVQKVVNEFRRYLHDLESNPSSASAEDLLKALAIVETMIDSLKVR